MKLRLPMHGRTHHPLRGSDPIPGLGEFFGRIVYGRILNDGTTLWTGSGDWSADGTGGWITFTIDPPFEEGFAFVASPNDGGGAPGSPPDLMPLTSNANSGFIQIIQVDLATVRIMFWDLDGNPGDNICGFDFQAVGT